MVQQTQPNVNQMQQPAVPGQQPVKQPATAQPAGQMQPEGETSIWKKWWLWLIIAVVIIGAGVGSYFLLK